MRKKKREIEGMLKRERGRKKGSGSEREKLRKRKREKYSMRKMGKEKE